MWCYHLRMIVLIFYKYIYDTPTRLLFSFKMYEFVYEMFKIKYIFLKLKMKKH